MRWVPFRGIFKGLLALNDYFEVIADEPALINQLVPVILSQLSVLPSAPVLISKVYGFFSGLGSVFSEGSGSSPGPRF